MAHYAGKPFIVLTRNISATVLGTKFNINAFPEEKNITVSLVEGKLKVAKTEIESKQKRVILTPKEQINSNSSNQEMNVSNFIGSSSKLSDLREIKLNVE